MTKYRWFSFIIALFCSCTSPQSDPVSMMDYEVLSTLPLSSLLLMEAEVNDSIVTDNDALIQYAIGQKYYSLGNHIKAFKSLSSVESVFKKNESLKIYRPRFFHLIGLTQFALDDYFEAIIYQEKYSYWANKLGNKEEYVNSLIALANIYMKLEKLEFALEYFNEAIVFIEDKNVKKEVSFWWYYNLGYFEIEQGNYLKSRYFFEKAIEFEKQGKTSYISIYGYTGLADLFFHYDRDSSILYFEKVEAIDESIAPEQHIYAKLGIGRGYHFKDKSKAINNYKQALNMSEKYGIDKHNVELCDSLYSIYKKNGNLILAEKYLSKGYTYLRKIRSAKGEVDLIINMSRIEKQKKQEIDALIFQQSIKDADIKALRLNIIIGILSLIALGVFSAILLKLNRQKKTQNDLLTTQNEKIKNQNKEITTKTKKLELASQTILGQNKMLENELSAKMLRITTGNEAFKQLTKIIDNLNIPGSDKHKIRSTINVFKYESFWNELDLQIAKTNEELFSKLSSLNPNLTSNNLKLAAFVKMNLSTKEIAVITYRSVDSVKMAKNRLRKKLGIKNPSIKLVSFLNSL